MNVCVYMWSGSNMLNLHTYELILPYPQVDIPNNTHYII